jgi:DNA (cytosine-5)-methyltransferase 1
MSKFNYIDLFAGAGGLSEGFIREGFQAVSHVEMDKYATETLKTQIAFHFLSKTGNINPYYSYLKKEISRDKLWELIPNELMRTVINEEISDKSIKNIFLTIDEQLDGKKVDLIIGGPPCQAFSIAGRSRDPKRMKWDRRKFLFRYYAEFLKHYQPNVFVFENVPGLLKDVNSRYLKEMLKLFSELGYTTEYKVLNAVDFGVLQKRERVILIGKKGKLKFPYPEFESIANGFKTKNDLFSDMPLIFAGENADGKNYLNPPTNYLKQYKIRDENSILTYHIARPINEIDREIYSIALKKLFYENKPLAYRELPSRLQTHTNILSFQNRFKVINPEGYSHTVVAHISSDGHYYIYPDLENIRSISVREAARIQSFPDNYYFEGSRTAAFYQIGNAVPPLMAQSIAKKIKLLL